MILEREPATEFEEVGTVQFVVTFKRKAGERPFTEDLSKTSVKTSVKIMEAITNNNKITIPELAVLAGVTERSIERNIQQLQITNRLRRVGPDKGGHWEVIQND